MRTDKSKINIFELLTMLYVCIVQILYLLLLEREMIFSKCEATTILARKILIYSRVRQQKSNFGDTGSYNLQPSLIKVSKICKFEMFLKESMVSSIIPKTNELH